ncbi:unnamed protein product [Camellia sinensis]
MLLLDRPVVWSNRTLPTTLDYSASAHGLNISNSASHVVHNAYSAMIHSPMGSYGRIDRFSLKLIIYIRLQ